MLHRLPRIFRNADQRSRMDPVLLLLEEYRQVYALALFRLNALDQRVPIIGGTLAGVLAVIGASPQPVQAMLLIGLPLSLVWFLRTTVNHARSIEDAFRRIDEIERRINCRVDQPVLQFQSSHPSRGVHVGGRTGTETIEAVLTASALLLAGCLYSLWAFAKPPATIFAAYSTYIAITACALLWIRLRLDRYRYQPRIA